jgi:hypothetical protein
MSRTAIIGSCITRDIWRECGVPLDEVLYISRTSLPSLVSRPVHGPVIPADPPPIDGIGRHSLRMVAADLEKTALAALVAHRPTHIVFDFIDERFDLLDQEGAIVTHSWELDCLGLIGGPGLTDPRAIPRLSDEADEVWRSGLQKVADLLHAPPLADAAVILHHAQWADVYRDKQGGTGSFGGVLHIWQGRPAAFSAHNALLERYRDLFLAAAPRAQVVQAAPPFQVADEGHIWGLSPFHYVPGYYPDVWRQLQALGV